MNDELSNFMAGQESAPLLTEEGKGKKKRGKKAAEGTEASAEKAPKEKKEKKPARDNIAYVSGLTRIDLVRKALQVAIAKKAKSAGREDAVKRYENEIETAKKRLTELVDQAKNSGNVVQGLIDLGEEPNKVLTHFIQDKENAFEAYLTDKGFKVSRNILRQVSNEVPVSFFEALPLDLHEVIITRHKKSDFRLQAVCRQFNFIAGVEDGTITQANGKWVLPGQKTEEVKTEEPKATSTETAGETPADQ